ncbi:MAG: protein-L-isoaspartate(D-aspartate) O-methyltransferase [Actinomycetota bacterium]
MARGQEGLARLVESEGVDPRIVEAFRAIAREDFVPDQARWEAYSDRPIGIPERQTTSQPSLIARMIDAAAIVPDDRVLEVGTGFGFQTALLAKVAREVVSIERHGSIAGAARDNLERAGLDNVEVVVGDGWQGRPETAPYDAIIVSAGASDVPAALTAQLADGGRLVIPLRSGHGDDVYLFRKRGDSLESVRLVTPARFVPLVPDDP